MKFIITENKLESVMFNYLDTIFNVIEFNGDFWFNYKNDTQIGVKFNYGNKKLVICSKIITELMSMFSNDSYERMVLVIENWAREKIGDDINKVLVSPYNLYLPGYITQK